MPVNVVGLDLLKTNLRRYDKDMAKVLEMSMNNAMKEFVERAQSHVPGEAELTNWNRRSTKSAKYARKRSFPEFNASRMKSGIKSRTSRTRTNLSGFISLARVENNSAPGAIYETAGRRHPMGQPNVRLAKTEWQAKKSRFSRSNNPHAGAQFIGALPKLYDANPKLDQKSPGKKSSKFRGRLIFRSLAEDNGQTLAKLMKAIEVFNRRLENRTSVVKKVA